MARQRIDPWGVLRVLIIAGVVLACVLFGPKLLAQDSPVTIAVTSSHTNGAVPGQTVNVAYVVTASVPLTRCRWATLRADAGGVAVYLAETTTPFPKGARNFVQPPVDMTVARECFWTGADGTEQRASSGVTLKVDDPAIHAVPPDCYPKPIGTGTWPSWKPTASGACTVWYCKNLDMPDGWKGRGMCFDWAESKSIEWLMGLTKDAADTEWKATPWQSMSDADREIIASLKAINKPLPIRFGVTPYSTYLSRPTYPVKPDGTRSTSSNGRIAVGAVCDCTHRIIGTTLYCSVSGQPNATDPTKILPSLEAGGAYAVCNEI